MLRDIFTQWAWYYRRQLCSLTPQIYLKNRWKTIFLLYMCDLFWGMKSVCWMVVQQWERHGWGTQAPLPPQALSTGLKPPGLRGGVTVLVIAYASLLWPTAEHSNRTLVFPRELEAVESWPFRPSHRPAIPTNWQLCLPRPPVSCGAGTLSQSPGHTASASAASRCVATITSCWRQQDHNGFLKI